MAVETFVIEIDTEHPTRIEKCTYYNPYNENMEPIPSIQEIERRIYSVIGFDAEFDESDISRLEKYNQQSAYKKGYETAKYECEDCPKAKEKDCTKCEHVYSAYQDGLNDFSEAIKKISNMRVPDRLEIFGTQYTENCLETHTPSKIFEKIRQYEQEKEEIQVGDEIKSRSGGRRFIVTAIYPDEEVWYIMFEDGTRAKTSIPQAYKKTGRHFPEIAEVLKKMQEGD